MRVGILTFHQSSNYGAALQTYALWKAVQELGHDPEIIDYVPWRSSAEYWKCVVKSRRMLARGRQYLKIKDFIHCKTKVSPLTYRTNRSLSENHHSYDVVMCGSDEIWNTNKPYIGLDSAYFLRFVDGRIIRKVSYAASFGNTLELNGQRQEIARCLDSFTLIGVRDRNSARLVQDCGKRAVKVLDPTFLTNFDDVESDPPLQRNYLLVYAYKLSPPELRFIRHIAAMKSLSVVSIGNQNQGADYNHISVSPAEWTRFFKHASHVVTSYYHGIIFSILYRKPFNALTKPNKLTKMSDLLDELDLSGRIFQSANSDKAQCSEINYSDVSKKLDALRATSKDFLGACLKS